MKLTWGVEIAVNIAHLVALIFFFPSATCDMGSQFCLPLDPHAWRRPEAWFPATAAGSGEAIGIARTPATRKWKRILACITTKKLNFKVKRGSRKKTADGKEPTQMQTFADESK